MGRPTHLIAILSLLFLCLSAPAIAFKRLRVGESLGDFPLSPLQEESPVSLSQVSGKRTTVVIFWATWSPRSAEALADLQELYGAYGPDRFGVVALNVDREEPDSKTRRDIQGAVAELGLTYPVSIDEGLLLFDRFGVVAVPSFARAGPDGTVVELLNGYANTTRPGFRERVLEALDVTPPEAAPSAGRTVRYTPKGNSLRYYRMGQILWRKGMHKRAGEIFERAVAEDPDFLDARQALAEALLEAGRTEEAEEVLLQLAHEGGAF